MTVTRQGRGFLVRPYINGKRTTLGTVKIERCDVCWGAEKECRACYARAEAKAHEWHDTYSGKAVRRETVDSFAARWIDDYPRPKDSTNYNYRSVVKRFAGAFEGRALGSITKPEARAWAQQHRYAAKTIRAMFSDAVNDGLIDTNPFSGLRLPVSKGRSNLAPLTQAEVETLAEIAYETAPPQHAQTIKAAILTLAYTCIRPGELFALRHEDVDLAAGELTPRYGVYRGFTDTTKTGIVRTRILPPPAAQAIRQIPRDLRTPYVFSNGSNRFDTASFSRRFNPARDKFEAQLDPKRRQELAESRPKNNPHLTPYELRHAGATMLLDNGASLADVAFQLGHSDTRLVERVYGHPDEGIIRDRLRRIYDPPQVTALSSHSVVPQASEDSR